MSGEHIYPPDIQAHIEVMNNMMDGVEAAVAAQNLEETRKRLQRISNYALEHLPADVVIELFLL